MTQLSSPKVVIDARFYGISHTGIGRYVENLLKYLTGPATLIVNKTDYDKPELAKYSKIVSHTHPYSILSQFEIPYLLSKLQPDLFHVPFSSIPVFWPGKVVVTFHDLIKHLSKGPDTTTKNHLFYWIKYCGYQLIDYISAKKASAIITPTKYWQSRIAAKYHLSLAKIYVTYEAVDPKFVNSNPITVPNLKKPFLVHTGNLYPHKNLNIVFEAIKNLPINLYLICARSVFTARAELDIKKLGLQEKIHFLGKLSDPAVKYIYQNAIALVFPSKVEGFGLNGLEAMSVGLPVISSNASCLPEVYGQAAIYFDPDDPTDLKKQILRLIKEQKLRTKLIKTGLRQVKKYSWDKMGSQTWKIYQNALL